MLWENSALFLVLILKTFVGIVENCRTLWDKTPSADLENNIEYDEQAPYNHIKNFKTDIVDGDKVMLLKNNMPQTVDRSLLD